MKIEQITEKKRWDELTAAEKQASYDRRQNTVRQWRKAQDQMDPTIAFPPKRKLGFSTTGNREVTAVDDFSDMPGISTTGNREVTAVDDFSKLNPLNTPYDANEFAGLSPLNTPYDANEFADLATPTPSKRPAAGTGADGPAGRYAPKLPAAGTGADGPAGRYAPGTNSVWGGELDVLQKNAGLPTGVRAVPGRSKWPGPKPKPMPFPGRDRWPDTKLPGKGRLPVWPDTKLPKLPRLPRWPNDDPNPKVGNINRPGTRMPSDTAKYADTGEAPEIQKPQGNLLKWIKSNATKRKEFDQDMVNK